jgi:hypothetical protein
LALLAAFVTGAMISTSLGSAREAAESPAATGTMSTPLAPAATEAAATTISPGFVPDRRGSAPTQAVRESATISSRPPIFAGTLSVKSVPAGAKVTINGKVAGVTPLTLPRQRAGSHAVQIAQDGFERWSAAVRVPADQLTQVSATLRPIAQ